MAEITWNTDMQKAPARNARLWVRTQEGDAVLVKHYTVGSVRFEGGKRISYRRHIWALVTDSPAVPYWEGLNYFTGWAPYTPGK